MESWTLSKFSWGEPEKLATCCLWVEVPLDKKLEDLVATLRLSRGPTRKAIIFISRESDSSRLSTLLNIPFIYSKSVDKDRLLENFIKDPLELIIISSSILSYGIDLDFIYYTINIRPYSIISFVQESGRIRKKEVSYILVDNIPTIAPTYIDSIDNLEDFINLDKALLVGLLRERRCIRS